MKEEIKNWFSKNWFKIVLIILLTIIGVGNFYYNEWRPSEIRRECLKEVVNNLSTLKNSNVSALDYLAGYQIILDMCLLKHGLAK